MRPVILSIAPENADQKVADGWQVARQRDFTGGESLALLPEKIGRNQLVRMVNAIISPEGLITEAWQMDTPLFVNVTTGIVVVPIPGSKLFTIYAAAGDYVVTFTFDPNSATPYDLLDASGYPGYKLLSHAAPVSISGITHGTPFLGKNYCCAATSLIIAGGELTTLPVAIAFGTVQTRTVNLVSITVTNTTAGEITLTSLSFEGAGSAAYGHSGAFPHVLAAAGTYTFDAVFNPTSPVAFAATMNLINTIGVLQIPVTGTAESKLSVLPVSYDFGLVREDSATASTTLQISNAGSVAAVVQSVTFEGEGSGNLSNTPALPYHAIVPAGGALDVAVLFAALATGVLAGTAKVVTDLGDISVPLAGIAAPLPTLTLEAPGFIYWTPRVGVTGMARLYMTNAGPGTVSITSVDVNHGAPFECYVNGLLSTSGIFPMVIAAGQSVPISIYTDNVTLPAIIWVGNDASTILSADIPRAY